MYNLIRRNTEFGRATLTLYNGDGMELASFNVGCITAVILYDETVDILPIGSGEVMGTQEFYNVTAEDLAPFNDRIIAQSFEAIVRRYVEHGELASSHRNA
jgi:hypothetical protein